LTTEENKMEKHLIVVFTEPIEGQEDDYNAFYDEKHVPEVVAAKGVVAGQRFILADPGHKGGPPHKYLTIYEIEGDLAEAQASLVEGFPTRSPLPDSFSKENKDWWFTAISERVESKPE
jgi:hypothetical protein